MNELLKSLFFKERQERIADSRSMKRAILSKRANEQKSEEQNRKFPILER